MAWIESHDTIWEHHKTIKLCRLLKISRAQAVGHLHGLWHFVLRNAWKDADLTAWGEPEIARASWWEGDAIVFLDALRECGFIDGFVVHDWVERAGRLVYDRCRKEKERKSANRRRKIGGKSKATVPYRTQPNPTQPDQRITDVAPQGCKEEKTEAGKEQRTKTARFTPPSFEEVRDYCLARKNHVDPLRFHAYYTSKGWLVGRSPMKSWQAAVVTWERGS